METGPRIDGVLDDAVWQSATPVEGFTQQEPNLGQPASERTEVRIVYDARTIYIAVHAYQAGGVEAAAGGGADPHAAHRGSGVVATEMRRDSDRLFDEDNFQVILDTFNDSRNGYMFVTTPLGAKLEQQIFDEGEGGGRGTTSNVNRNWDGVWDAAAKITDDGWTAEIAIPTNTLRFMPDDEQTWGINFLRHTRRKNELAYWAPIPSAYTLTRVSLAGELRGLQNLSLRPRPEAEAVRGRRPAQPRAVGRQHPDHLDATDVGLDARYGVTPSLNLDLTMNTDFAQVEVDEQQVNLTRFGLFFPEKRDFFLENSNAFTVGTGSSFTSTPVQTDLFFSRRIGLSRHRPAGADHRRRAPHRQGREEQRRRHGRADRQRLCQARRELLRQPLQPRRVQPLARRRAVHQQGRPWTAAITSTAPWRSTPTSAWARASRSTPMWPRPTRPLASSPAPGKTWPSIGRIAYRDPRLSMWVNYLDVQDNFNAEAGFVQRRGIRTTKAYFSPTPRPKRGNIKLIEPMYVLTYTTDQHNRLIGRMHHLMVGTTLRDDSFINVIYQKNLDVLDVPFNVRPNVRIPVGTYHMDEWSFTYNTSPGKRLFQRLTFQPNRVLRRHAPLVLGRLRRARHQPVVERVAVQPQRREDAVGRLPGQPGHAARRLHLLAQDDDPQPHAVQHQHQRDLEQRPLQPDPPRRQRPLRGLQRPAPDRTSGRRVRAEGSAARRQAELPGAEVRDCHRAPITRGDGPGTGRW